MTLPRLAAARLARIGVVFVVLLMLPFAAHASDLPAPPAGPGPVASRADIAAFLDRRAALLLVRETFSAATPDEVESDLVATAARLAARGLGQDEDADLSRRLLAESSYYLVSLQYLVMAGGAAWPGDRSEATYAAAALAALDGLEVELPTLVAAGEDPMPLLVRAQAILALTEGYTSTPAELDVFAARDSLVDVALRAYDDAIASDGGNG